MAGLLTDVCLFNTAVSAVTAGYRVIIPADASGTTSALADAVAYDRPRSVGAEVASTYGILFELYSDLSTPDGQRDEAIAAASVSVSRSLHNGRCRRARLRADAVRHNHAWVTGNLRPGMLVMAARRVWSHHPDLRRLPRQPHLGHVTGRRGSRKNQTLRHAEQARLTSPAPATAASTAAGAGHPHWSANCHSRYPPSIAVPLVASDLKSAQLLAADMAGMVSDRG